LKWWRLKGDVSEVCFVEAWARSGVMVGRATSQRYEAVRCWGVRMAANSVRV
jgi:hypothetical protein